MPLLKWPNLNIAVDLLAIHNSTVARERLTPSSTIGGVYDLTTVLSPVTVSHVTSSIDISCAALYHLIRGPEVGDHCSTEE